MNNPAVTKEKLLNTAEKILTTEGLHYLNIRRLASECNISVGCVYNYYTSKSDLIFALMENFWNRVFTAITADSSEKTDFMEFLSETYGRLLLGLQTFTTEFLNHMTMLTYQEKTIRNEKEIDYWLRMKQLFKKEMEKDSRINNDTWNETFTQEAYIDFLISNMMNSLCRGEKECAFLTETVKRCLY